MHVENFACENCWNDVTGNLQDGERKAKRQQQHHAISSFFPPVNVYMQSGCSAGASIAAEQTPLYIFLSEFVTDSPSITHKPVQWK